MSYSVTEFGIGFFMQLLIHFMGGSPGNILMVDFGDICREGYVVAIKSASGYTLALQTSKTVNKFLLILWIVMEMWSGKGQ